MTRLVVVQPASAGVSSPGYDVRLGPLRFVAPLSPLGEELGDGLAAVGAALVPAERRPRPIDLKLPVRAWHRETDPTAVGLRMRRQTRQLLENAQWRMGGLFMYWMPDPDLDAWVLLGGGKLTETDPGVTFGDFELELSDLYLVGRPGTHRAGRRLDLADRRTGLVPRDTRGTLYSTDYATQPLPAEPLILPGDLQGVVGAYNRVPSSSSAGLQKGARRLWRSYAATNGEAASYVPDPVLVSGGRLAYQDVENVGSVRVWDIGRAGATYPPLAAGYSRLRDDDPETYYGWERVYGDLLTADRPLAMDNGACRVVWLGPQATQGLAIEYHDASSDAMRRSGRILHALNATEVTVVELTPERGVIEIRAADRALRVILQRGWWGPRIESYNDSGGVAPIEYAPTTGSSSDAISAFAMTATPGVRALVSPAGTHNVAQATADVTVDSTPTVISAPAVSFRRPRTNVLQWSCPPGPAAAAVGSLALVDARPAPVLLGRGRG